MEVEELKKMNLPNATAILVLGILSLIFCWMCYGSIIGVILGIIAIILASEPRKMYLQNPQLYTESSYKNLNAGRVCAIIGLCISLAMVVLIILMVLGIAAIGLGSSMM